MSRDLSVAAGRDLNDADRAMASACATEGGVDALWRTGDRYLALTDEVPEPLRQLGVRPLGDEPGVLALAHLLWSREPADPPVRIAALFDKVAGRPGFAAERETLDEPERGLVLAYLRAGAPVLRTTATMPDVLAPDSGVRVAIGFRTDGRYVWTDAAGHYLDRYGKVADPGLLAHIRARGHRFTAPGTVALFRAAVLLQARGR
ncbi:hypothetical protein [Catenuloplanes japonicus]|uniref:hypothetical protein n=1 Tax=Catenuloplanes japonicus TaxID=33876 RepID=UPI00068EA66B|nr:hypothetical protein [Catenuloplanes japonicus]